MRAPVDLAKSYLLLNHGPVTLVTSAHDGRRNVMAASWAMPVDFYPPKVAVVIDKNTYTRELIEASGEFVLNIPTSAQAGQVLAVGNCSGRDSDKFDRFGLSTKQATVVSAPLIASCAAWLECKVMREPHNQGNHDLFLANVVAAHADPMLFSNNHWHFTSGSPRTLHYVAGGEFFVTGPSLDCKMEGTL